MDLPASTVPLPHPLATRSEWLLTNALGGYAMGTPAGVNTRRYHALLVAALDPPVGRVAALSAVADTLTLRPGAPDETDVHLTPFHFRNGPHSDAPPVPATFRRGPDVSWTYTLSAGIVTKTLSLYKGLNAAALTYRIDLDGPARLTLRPLVALRDHHHLVRPENAAAIMPRPLPDTPGVRCTASAGVLTLSSPDAAYEHAPETRHDFEYVRDGERGMDATEHLFRPGSFTTQGQGPKPWTVRLLASVGEPPGGDPETDRAERARRATALVAGLADRAPEADRGPLARLALASDDFIARRGPADRAMTTIIAGYPWFTDWGRDTMIALPGLLLATGRHAEALNTLRVFAAHRRRGLIPNRFDDAGPAHYNTADAPLWFLHAAAEYRRASGDRAGYREHLAPACLEIIESYRRGTDFDIRMDEDGLITAGNESTQLTWMDARRGGIIFTPRHGKAVEINALWHHGLLATARAIEDDDPGQARQLRDLAARARRGFSAFVRPDGLGLHDRLEPDAGGWRAIPEIRPNQVFAVSLAHSPLDERDRRAVPRVVRERLLTPVGLRTLDPADPGYQPRYEGDMMARDRAYHNGTVWPWLLGPYAEALLRVGGFAHASREEARALLRPLLDHLAEPGLGQLPEVFDGEDTPRRPRRPEGCPAQAWSVAEAIRLLVLLADAGA